jgi:hypothetical protein
MLGGSSAKNPTGTDGSVPHRGETEQRDSNRHRGELYPPNTNVVNGAVRLYFTAVECEGYRLTTTQGDFVGCSRRPYLIPRLLPAP